MLGNVVEQLSSISSLDEKMQTLESKIKDLSCREADVIAMLQDAEFLTGKKRKRQVDNWLDNVQKKKNEFQSFERDVQGSNVLQKLRLGKQAEKMIGEVAELVKEGRFREGLLLDAHDTKQVPLLTEKLIGQEFKQNLKKIQDSLKKDDILRIGIYGMAGVGKTTLATHIHNILLKRSRIYNHVYWVTVSQGYNIHQLQNDIAKMVKLDLSEENDEKRRAAKLSKAITSMKKTVLILDDVWEHFSLVKVGIPCRVNGCKLILTTRSLEVCRMMECQEKIKVGTLSEKEAWNLFMKKLGHGMTLPPEVKEIAMSVAKRCGGLTLGIITMAGSMREVNDIREWRNLLEELKESMKRQENMEAEVFPILKLSYSRLKDEKLQLCFLYCALYPEDYRIQRDNQLIYKFIVEELIDGRKNRQAQFDMGHTLLNKLENACLLERCEKFDCRSVKMHDLMREMALKITKESPRFMVKAGVQLCEIPKEQEWSEDLEKVSLMCNKIEEIPDGISPRCPKLSTLLLQENSNLRRISNSFFTHMCALRVLDLSRTAIVDLPGSISDLENLTALLVRFCDKLMHVPPLGKLRALQVLNLSGTRIKEIPQGMEMLADLKCLYMEDMKDMERFPTGILSRLSCLQVLRLDSFSPGLHIEEVEQLGHLEEFEGQLYGMRDFKKFIKSGRYRQLNICRLQVGHIKYRHFSFCGHDKEVKIGNCRLINDKEDWFSFLPQDIQYLYIDGCEGVVCPSFTNARGLKECRISRCEGMECFLSLSSDEVVPPIKSVEVLDLHELKNLSALIRWEGSRFSIPNGTFFSLKDLFISDCHKIKKLLPPGMLQHLPNLESICVYYCYQMEEIIGDDGEEMDTGHNSSSSSSNYYNNSTIFTLPKLKEFGLKGLPELKSICRGVMACDSLEFIWIKECTKLKRMPFSLPLSAPTALKSIKILNNEELWWESLEWEHPNAKDVLQPLLQFDY